MKRNTILGLVGSIVVLAGLIFYSVTRPVPAKAPGVSEALPLPAGTYSEHTAQYDIATYYATSTPLRGAANTAALALMEKFVSDSIGQFKSDGNFANLTPQDIEMMRGRKEKLEIMYLIASSPHTISYIFTTYEDTLGAHGNTFFHTFTFNTSTGALVTLSDVFTLNTPYLETLSSISRTKLPGVIGSTADASFIQNGTEPKESNFQNFFIDNSYFVVLFAPYAVAPYSAGPQTLRIPMSELGNILQIPYRP
ncbi:MAG TPA: RsiV family protein [Candidatus Paceibacterota bacterium]|nr:RsiV family protein [Candidatus Paceibacterota bacterium]